MPKSYFHVRHDRVLFEHRRGGQFPDIVAACNWALSDARLMIAGEQFAGPMDRHWIDIGTGIAKGSSPKR